MAFHDESLPDEFQYGSTFGSGFNTVVQGTASGHEYRLARQAQARHRYTLEAMLRTGAEAMTLKAFALARRGSLHSFRLTDHADYTSNDDGKTAATTLDQVLGTGDGTETDFQLIKTYDEAGLNPYVRPIELPVAGSVVVALDGVPTVAFTITNPGGLITFTSPPGVGVVVTAGYEFEVPVRFETAFDAWTGMRADAFNVWSVQQLACVEVLNEIAWPERWPPGGSKDHGSSAYDLTLSYAAGELHSVSPSVAAINVFLPSPNRKPGGWRHFVVENASGSAGNVQIRDDAGAAVGSAFGAGQWRNVALLVEGSTTRWMVT